MADTALIMIDLINEIVHEDGKFAGYGYPAQVAKRDILAKTNRATAAARAAGMPVIWVRVGFAVNHANCPAASPLFGAAKQYGALLLGTWATEFHAALKIEAGDVTLVKPRVSAFYETGLEAVLRAQGIRRILIGGVATDLAVQTAVRDGHDRDYQVVVLEDLCAATGDAEHDAVIGALGRIAVVTSSRDALP